MLDCFYNEIIKEAATGYIDCDFFIPICFGTRELVNNELVDITIAREFPNAMVPTLIIKDREKLNSSIIRYISLAKEFYKDDKRLMDVTNKEKYIIASLLSNVLVNDFNDFNNLFERNSKFLEDKSLEEFENPVNIGYVDKLKSNVIVKIEKQSIVEESPYGMKISLADDNDEIIYKFPTIRFGIDNNKAYIYAVQQEDTVENKKIERLLRKVGEGFDEKNSEKDEIENPENLYSVSPWSLVALSIFIPIIKNYTNVDEFVAPYFLINRFNAVEISYEILKEKYKDNMKDERIKTILQKKEESVNNHDDLQRNITDKFIRNFRRLDYHFGNIDVDMFPLEQDSMIHFSVTNQLECNNSLLKEVYTVADSYKSNSKGLK